MPDNFDALMGNEEAGLLGQEDGTQNGDNMVLDLSGTSSELPKFDPIPKGIYPAVVEDVDFTTSQSGNPMLSIVLVITDPEYKDRKVFYHAILNKETGLSRLKRFLVNVVPETDFGKFDPKKFADEGEAVGAECRVQLTIRKYQDSKVNNVTDVLAPESGDFL